MATSLRGLPPTAGPHRTQFAALAESMLPVVLLLAFLVVAVVVVTDGGARARAERHLLRFADGLEVTTLNPWYANTANIGVLSELTMAHFSRIGRDGRLVPELVTEIPSQQNGGMSRDGKTVTWHLRRGVRWSDGAPFDAHDVLFTISAVKNAKNNFSVHGLFDEVEQATAPDPYTVVMRLSRPNSSVGRLFNTFGLTCILPRHLLAQLPSIDRAPYNTLPVGIGPFRYVRFTRGEAVVMEANPLYFRGRPKLKRIEYKIIPDDNTIMGQLQTGELDLWELPGDLAERAAHLPGVVTARRPGTFVRIIDFNVQRPLVADHRVRAALRLALDRNGLLVKVAHGYGTVTDAVVPPVEADADPSFPVTSYDPAAAAQLLDAAGWRLGPDGIRTNGDRRLTLRLVAGSGLPSVATGIELVRDAWRHIGVGVEVQFFSAGQFFAPAARGGPLVSGTFDAAVYSAPFSDAMSLRLFFACASVPPDGFNYSRYCNPSVDAGINRALATLDVSQRRRALWTVQQTIANDVPAIIAYRRDDVVAYGQRVTGYQPTLLTFLDDMLNVDTT